MITPLGGMVLTIDWLVLASATKRAPWPWCQLDGTSGLRRLAIVLSRFAALTPNAGVA